MLMAIYRPGLRGASSSQPSMDCGSGKESRLGMVRNGQPELWDRWSVRLDRRLVGKEDAVVDHAGQDAAEERSDPVDAVVGPVIAGYQSWAEGAGRVDGCAG